MNINEGVPARVVALVLISALMPACVTSKSTEVPWEDCARSKVVGWIESDTPISWPVVDALPKGVSVRVVSLGAFPPDAIHDALYRTLHLVPSMNVVYVEQFGGFAGIRQLYGPISLAGHCSAPVDAP